MKRSLILALLLAAPAAARADFSTTGFEDLNPSQLANTHNNNAGPGGQFISGGNSFNNSYNPKYGSWSGWAISSETAVTPPTPSAPDYTYQYTAITGGGANSSKTYAVADTYGSGADPFHPSTSVVQLASGASPVSVQVTNTAYDYFSMANGDSFAHKFGAGDFLLLTIAGYGASGAKVGEVDYYLANFLGTDPSRYYIVANWQTVDLSSLAMAGARSLSFGLESSDNDPTYGINTPAEFAMDNLVTSAVSVPEPSSWLLCLGGIGLGASILRRDRARNRTAPL